MKKIAVVGTGYLGLVKSGCLAKDVNAAAESVDKNQYHIKIFDPMMEVKELKKSTRREKTILMAS